jgi:hypothetical protein
MRVLTILISLVFALCAPLRATADDFLSLNAWLQKSEDERELSYLPIRCAGLYIAMGAVVPDSEKELVKRHEKVAAVYLQVAADLRASRYGTSTAEQVKGVRLAVEAISRIYIQRFSDNYARRGQMFVGDELIEGDAAICREIASAENN